MVKSSQNVRPPLAELSILIEKLTRVPLKLAKKLKIVDFYKTYFLTQQYIPLIVLWLYGNESIVQDPFPSFAKAVYPPNKNG